MKSCSLLAGLDRPMIFRRGAGLREGGDLTVVAEALELRCSERSPARGSLPFGAAVGN